jgi:hypothetical protein
MTQFNDGMGRNSGTPSRAPGPASRQLNSGGAADVPRLPHPSAMPLPAPVPAADTDDMQELLRKIAAQIADAEQRQGAELDGVRTRLTDLAGQAEAVKDQAPPTLQSGLSSIEGRISQMAQTVEAVSREIKTASAVSPQVPSALAEIAPAESAASGPKMHVRGFGSGQVRGSNAVPGVEKATAQLAAVAPQSKPAGAQSIQTGAGELALPLAKSSAIGATTKQGITAATLDPAGPWDKAAADALANIFSDEETGDVASVLVARTSATADQSRPANADRSEPPALASAQPQSTRVAAPAATKPASLAPPPLPARPIDPTATIVPPPVIKQPVAGKPALAPSAPAQPTSGLSLAMAPAALPPPPAAISGQDRDWLNARFAEIATQVQRSLIDNRPDKSFVAMGQRFDKLEASLATVVTAVQSGASQNDGSAAMQSLEVQISALKSQVEATVNRLEGLDALKADIAAIAHRLGALDRLEKSHTQLSGHVAGSRGEIGTLARNFDEFRGAGLGLSSGAPPADPRLDTLNELLESQVIERREGESATVAVLQAIQGAIDQLTERMHQFEDTVAAVVLGGAEDTHGDIAAHAPPQPAAQVHTQPVALAEPSATDQRPRRTAPEATASLHVDQIQAEAAALAAEGARLGRVAALEPASVREPAAPPVEAAIPRTRRGLGNILRPGHAADPALASATVGTSAPRTEREDLIEVARRVSGTSAEAGAAKIDDAQAGVDIETIASRLPGQKRIKPKPPRGGFFTFEKSSARPVLVVALFGLLAAGLGMLYGTLSDRPQTVPARSNLQKNVPGKVGALPQQQDTVAGYERRTRVGESAQGTEVSQQRDDRQIRRMAADSDDLQTADMKAADLDEAALTIMKPSSETEPSGLHTGSSLPMPAAQQPSITTGILIDSGAPMPSARDLQRYSEEQRMARISSHLGDKAVQKTEREHAVPASHTPDAAPRCPSRRFRGHRNSTRGGECRFLSNEQCGRLAASSNRADVVARGGGQGRSISGVRGRVALCARQGRTEGFCQGR